ncbi:reverse transcriptase/maturase family protein [uncultured Dialister sp.]|uniref:reverse transcriptase/maturase family protein n=1 Tax=uncultured Dialister sp. TaxID=278064 RepID=UPI0033900A14
MKRYGNLFQKLVSMENLELAYHNARKGKTWQRAVKWADKRKEELLQNIQTSLINHTFHTSPYKTRTIHEPKERLIFILPFYPDRIVQHAIVNVLSPVWEKLFISDSYACRKGKGQHKGSSRCMEFARKYEYCLQGDISKFYPSIRHDLLKEVIRRKIKDKEILWLLNDIIDSTGTEKNIPIGNFLSQWFGNLFLNELDTYVKQNLKCRAYIRYCDDFILLSNDKQQVQEWAEKIRAFVHDRLDMKLSKLNIYHTYQGIDFLGYRHFSSGKILVRKRTAKRVRRRMASIKRKMERGTLDIDRARGQIASARGWMKHAQTYNLRKALEMDRLEEAVGIHGR